MDSQKGAATSYDKKQWQKFAGATEMVPVVTYTPEYVTSALFPHILASQMSSREYKAEHRRRQTLKGCLLSVQLQATSERHEFFQLALTAGEDGAVQIVVVASTVGLLRSLCASIESVISRRFPGLSQDVDVQFSGPDGECVWKVGDDMTLGTILTRKDWERRVGVELVGNGERLDLKIRDIFKAVPGIFFSHSWNDHSTEVGPEIRTLIENRMRELVWYDEQMMSKRDQFQSLMTEGVKNAWVVVIFLSREALASQNCLREMCKAREQQLTANTRIIVLAMEPEVTFAEISKWSTTEPLTFSSEAKGHQGETRTVHARTVKWVQENLLGVNIYPEWIEEALWAKWVEGKDARRKKQGAKPSEDDAKPPKSLTPTERSAMRSETINRIIENVRAPLATTLDGGAPEFEIIKEGEVWILGIKDTA
ncbi:hypothetical protein T484DRAFT_1833172 [Baffinella frigidus]|nr:hypothetical protein T484DRAFT_1833172 [Cryptophyta sp. CCMP2293]